MREHNEHMASCSFALKIAVLRLSQGDLTCIRLDGADVHVAGDLWYGRSKLLYHTVQHISADIRLRQGGAVVSTEIIFPVLRFTKAEGSFSSS